MYRHWHWQRPSARSLLVVLAAMTLPLGASCGRTIAVDLDTDSDGPADAGTAGPGPGTTADVDDGLDDDSDDGLDDGAIPDAPPEECGAGRFGCTDRLDVLIVVDNSRTMAEEQAALARSVPALIDPLQNPIADDGSPIDLDIQIMVTTTDAGNPSCTPFQPPGYEPASGAPISTACIKRLEDFADAQGEVFLPEACLDYCPFPVEPEDPFIAFGSWGSNVPNRPWVDIDGDGLDDSPEAQALACLVPQGINGCGFEAPLEAMRRALYPTVDHNSGNRPFLRPDAALAIILVTDEADCSISSNQLMEDASLWNINPVIGLPSPSSALCWNAGVECEGPDANGIFSECRSADEFRMHSVDEYISFLRDELGEDLQKDIVMVQLAGVPSVLAHNPNPPFEPIAGGTLDLLYRNWQEDDIQPEEAAMGITAEWKQFDLGIGPGCTGIDDQGNFTGQAVPPVRMLEVCEGLNIEHEGYQEVRCCVESICDDHFQGAALCLQGMLLAFSPPEGPFG